LGVYVVERSADLSQPFTGCLRGRESPDGGTEDSRWSRRAGGSR